MAYATANGRLCLSALSSGPIALVLAAVALASGTAAWKTHVDPAVSGPGPAASTDASTFFDNRFFVGGERQSFATAPPPDRFFRSLPSELEIKLQQAKGLLAQRFLSEGSKKTFSEEPPPPPLQTATVVPLPRARPAEAKLELQSSRPLQADDRTLLQKFSDLFPARITLASLAPDGGLLSDAPDLSALGYDNLTAVYDISAHTVFMPNGSKLEAHSGFGSLKDDPGHVSEPNIGATPPAVYDLKPRERAFHSVQALRMIPVDGDATRGRAGLLVHSYMLGPNGDSNGCVSIKNYDQFLRAFQNGELKRLVVVASLNDAARRPLLKS
jgi:hypothetical protein